MAHGAKKRRFPKHRAAIVRRRQLALAMLEFALQREIDFGFVGVDDGYPKFLC